MSSLTAAQRRQVLFERNVMFFGCVLHVATQVSHLRCPWSERWQRLLSIPVSAVPTGTAAVAPAFYVRHREIILVAFKLIYWSFPLLRKPAGIQRVLDAPATPGPLGFPLDVLKMLWGTRMFAQVYASLSMPQALAPYFVCQVFSATMLRLNRSLCGTRLLQDPLTRRRLRLFNYLSAQALLPPGSMRWGGEAPDADAGAQCSFFLTLLVVLVGVVLPTVALGLSRSGLNHKSRAVVWFLGLQLSWAVALAVTSEVRNPFFFL